MDRSRFQNASSQRPARRDVMFCHQCADEWYRDQHGLTCPECGSDFTEIIEENNDPRDNGIYVHDNDGGGGSGGGSGDSHSLPDLEPDLPYQYMRATPDDPGDSDISNFQFTQTAPGRFNVQAVITRSVSPEGLQRGVVPTSIGGFMSMLNGLTGAAARIQSPPQNATPEPRSSDAQSQSHIQTGRFTYHGSARLYPRDSDNPGPRIEPVDDITNVVTGLMAAFGATPGNMHGQSRQHDTETTFPNEAAMPHPFFQLFSSMGLLGNGGQPGDFVYSQEGLDRIISQIMEQTAASNAPGPARQTDIERLSRERVTVEMLGPEGKAECSICMDEVSVGEQVTMLPCKHWFHHSCVSAWLSEHDTCPHCRQGISKRREEGQDQTGQAAGNLNASGANAIPDPTHADSRSGHSRRGWRR